MRYVVLVAMCLSWNSAHAFDWQTEQKAVGGVIAFFNCKDELDDYHPEKVEKFLPVANEYLIYVRDAMSSSPDIEKKVTGAAQDLEDGGRNLMCLIAQVFMEGYLLNEFE